MELEENEKAKKTNKQKKNPTRKEDQNLQHRNVKWMEYLMMKEEKRS